MTCRSKPGPGLGKAPGPRQPQARPVPPRTRRSTREPSASRSVAENTPAGRNIGEPVEATDPDQEDTLSYSLAGIDQIHFSIDRSSGQIKVRSALDFETRQQYTVDVQVTDGLNAAGDTDSTADATITVTITVNNLDEPGSLESARHRQAPQGHRDHHRTHPHRRGRRRDGSHLAVVQVLLQPHGVRQHSPRKPRQATPQPSETSITTCG